MHDRDREVILEPDPTSEAASSGRRNEDAAAQVESSRYPLVTTRIGLAFLGLAVVILVCGAVAQGTVGEVQDTIVWVAVIAACSLAGLTSMRSVRTLRIIEQELRRRHPDRRRWQTARPVVGSDPITEGWNELLDTVRQSSHEAARSCGPAPLDQEVITLARAMRGLPVGWVITDTEAVIRFLSPPACGILALRDDDKHVGKDLLALLGLRNEEGCSNQTLITGLLGQARTVVERCTLVHGARTAHLRVTRTRLDGRSGDAPGMVWVLSDETQQRLTTEARDQFVMTATHELRTPLNNLQAYAEALQEKDGLDVDQQKEFCNIINSEANRLGRLVDQLLTVSQMEAGAMTINRHELEILPMLDHATDQLRANAEQKQIDLQTDLSAKLPTVLGDRDKLQATLVNLIGNAVKYTNEGGKVVLRCGAENRWVRIDIEDNGPGIPESEQGKVFEKFFRGDATRHSDQRGNGLGLAFAREIARLHGGDIELQSTPGEGSTFTLRLPAAGESRSGI